MDKAHGSATTTRFPVPAVSLLNSQHRQCSVSVFTTCARTVSVASCSGLLICIASVLPLAQYALHTLYAPTSLSGKFILFYGLTCVWATPYDYLCGGAAVCIYIVLCGGSSWGVVEARGQVHSPTSSPCQWPRELA